MKNYVKMIGVIVLTVALGGCASNGQTIYDKDGNAVQTTDTEGQMLNIARDVNKYCNQARVDIAKATSNGLVMTPDMWKNTSPQAQSEYFRNQPITQALSALTASVAKPDASCQVALQEFYKYKTAAKLSNNSLIRSALNIAGVLGGIYLGGNVLQGIQDGAGATYNTTGDANFGGGSINTSPPTIVDPVIVEIPAP